MPWSSFAKPFPTVCPTYPQPHPGRPSAAKQPTPRPPLHGALRLSKSSASRKYLQRVEQLCSIEIDVEWPHGYTRGEEKAAL
jgi:hypothetical protein